MSRDVTSFDALQKASTAVSLVALIGAAIT